MAPSNWQTRALCREVDPELFFPDPPFGSEQAREICAACPVRDACLQAALDNNERFGIWGGLTEQQRRALPARRRTCDWDGCTVLLDQNSAPNTRYCDEHRVAARRKSQHDYDVRRKYRAS